MKTLEQWTDWSENPDAWAKSLGVSREAIDIYRESDVIDLHIDSFIWTRMIAYDLTRRHGPSPFGGKVLSQVDLPRIREAQVKGGVWSITTNPYRVPEDRKRAFRKNLERIQSIFKGVPSDVALVRTAGDYQKAKANGLHAAFLGVQGGNAFDYDDETLDDVPPGLLVRVTLVHLSTSSFGTTSAPTGSRKGEGLTQGGARFIERLDEKKIFVDLAHASRETFWDAVAAHDDGRPLLVSHTGVSAVHPHWRNIDDRQIRAIADSGGTVGVMYHSGFLGGKTTEAVVDHLAHIVSVAGEDYASLGSDWDGLVFTPEDMPTCLELPRLVETMLRRGFSGGLIQKIMGGNFLRALRHLRGEETGE